MKRIVSLFITLVFTAQSIFGFGSTAAAAMLPMVPVSYPMLTGLQLNPQDPFELSFIVDLADKPDISQAETQKLIRYFLATLTIPEDELWVNLSPYEKDRILPESLSVTDAGKDLLTQDYILKKFTASLTDPDSDSGKKFWDNMRQKIYEKYGTTDVPYNLFSKVWIVPEHAVVYVIDNTAYISESHLKVMLDNDYKARKALDVSSPEISDVDQLSSQVAREILIPELEKEVNEGESFAPLRQVFYSQILAYWFKKNLKENIISQVYVDKNKLKGVDLQDPKVKEEIYAEYLQAFKEGAYNTLREEYDPGTERVIEHKLYSGGYVGRGVTDNWIETRRVFDRSVLAQKIRRVKNTMLVTIALLVNGAASQDVFAQTSGQKIFSYTGIEHSRTIVQDDTDEIALLKAYVSQDDILSLNGKKTSIEGRKKISYVIYAPYFSDKDNFENIFKSGRYGWQYETVVIAAQEKLKAKGFNIAVDGDYGPETIAALRQDLAQQGISIPSANASSSTSLTDDQRIKIPITSEAGSSTAIEKGKQNDLSQRSIGGVASREVSTGRETPSLIDPDIQALDHKIDSLMDQISLLQNRVQTIDSTRMAGGGSGGGDGDKDKIDSLVVDSVNVPAQITSQIATDSTEDKDGFVASIWNDTWYASKGPGQYGWYSLAYNADKVSASISGETAGWKDPELGLQGTIGTYLGVQFNVSPSFVLSGGLRLATQKVNGVTFGKIAYSIDNKFWKGAGLTYARAKIPGEDPDVDPEVFKEAILLSTDFKIGRLSLSPGVFIAGQELDWSTFWNFGISDRVKIFGEKNLKASAAAFGPAPNDIWRMGTNIGLGKPDGDGNFRMYLLPYLTANNFNKGDLPNTNLGGGLVFSWTPNLAKKKVVSVASPPPVTASDDKALGGIDLSVDDQIIKVRSSGPTPVNSIPMAPVNFDPSTFEGFDFRIIQMIPLLHLGKYIEKNFDSSAMQVSLMKE